MLNDAQKKLLSDKLDASHVKPPSQFGPKGDYLEGWHVISEANRIFGFDGWSYEVISATAVAQEARKIGKAQKDGWGVTYTSKVRVEVAGVYREDFGAGHGYDVDLGLAHESAVKEAVTDALKRALRTFGNPFGLALYDKSRANVEATPEPKPAVYNSLVAELRKAVVAADVGRMWRDQEFIDLRKSMPEEWQAKLQDEATKIGNNLKAKEAANDTVKDIQDAFPGSTVKDERITDISGRELEYQEAGE
jgi:DNA recombination protein Rad52